MAAEIRWAGKRKGGIKKAAYRIGGAFPQYEKENSELEEKLELAERTVRRKENQLLRAAKQHQSEKQELVRLREVYIIQVEPDDAMLGRRKFQIIYWQIPHTAL